MPGEDGTGTFLSIYILVLGDLGWVMGLTVLHRNTSRHGPTELMCFWTWWRIRSYHFALDPIAVSPVRLFKSCQLLAVCTGGHIIGAKLKSRHARLSRKHAVSIYRRGLGEHC